MGAGWGWDEPTFFTAGGEKKGEGREWELYLLHSVLEKADGDWQRMGHPCKMTIHIAQRVIDGTKGGGRIDPYRGYIGQREPGQDRTRRAQKVFEPHPSPAALPVVHLAAGEHVTKPVPIAHEAALEAFFRAEEGGKQS